MGLNYKLGVWNRRQFLFLIIGMSMGIQFKQYRLLCILYYSPCNAAFFPSVKEELNLGIPCLIPGEFRSDLLGDNFYVVKYKCTLQKKGVY